MPLRRKKIRNIARSPNKNTGFFVLNAGRIDAGKTGKILGKKISEGVFKITHIQGAVKGKPREYFKLKNPFELVPSSGTHIEPVEIPERKKTGSILDRKEIYGSEIKLVDEWKLNRDELVLLKAGTVNEEGKKTPEFFLAQVNSKHSFTARWTKKELNGKEVFVRLDFPHEIRDKDVFFKKKAVIKTQRKEK